MLVMLLFLFTPSVPFYPPQQTHDTDELKADVMVLSPFTTAKAVETLIKFVDPWLDCIITNL